MYFNASGRLIWPYAIVHRKLPREFSVFSENRTLSLSDFTSDAFELAGGDDVNEAFSPFHSRWTNNLMFLSSLAITHSVLHPQATTNYGNT